MDKIDDKSIDMILCDLPYGTTKCKWDVVLPFDKLWEQYKRIIKDNGAIILFAKQPFTSDLVNSNRDMFRYELIWEKTRDGNSMQVKKQPSAIHENIEVFYKKQPTYNDLKFKVDEKYIDKRKSIRDSFYKSEHYSGVMNGRDFEFELKVIERYEPKLFKAVNNIFGDSYEYTRAYKNFCKEMDKKYGNYSKFLAEKYR